MVHKPRFRAFQHTRAFALLLAAVLPVTLVPVGAAEKIGDGVTPTYDEAYYATLDYYGNLTEGSVVKSYALNGATALTDYGSYDEVVNLTDGTVPATKNGTTTFDFSEEDAPSHFYFEGKTTAPFTALPWTITMSYTLNGVPTKAEDLAGKTGTVDINLNILPNKAASDYAKNNYTLEAMAMFNQDDILSLKAEGAQVQLVGNLRTVLFLALPGEERHFTIEVGSDDFTFGGMTFLMVPATLAQLDQIAELSDRKDELEDDYEKLNDSLDTTLNALNNMTGSLNASAKGLDELNEARGTISAGKGTIYDGIDTSKLDMESIAALLDPVTEQVQAASETLKESKDILQTMNGVTVSLQTELSQIRNDLKNLEDNSDGLKDIAFETERLKGSLNTLQSALSDIDDISTGTPSDMQTLADTLYSSYLAAAKAATDKENPDETVYFKTIFTAQGYDDTTAAGMAAACATNDTSIISAADPSGKLLAAYQQLYPLYYVYITTSPATFKDFCVEVLTKQGVADAETQATLLNEIHSISGNIDDATSSVNDTLSKIKVPAAGVAKQLAVVCGDMNALYNVIEDGQSLAHTGQSVAQKADVILSDLDGLDSLLSAYEPKAQESLKTLEDLSVTAAGSIRNAEKLITDTENLARTSGAQLDTGTKQTLEGLAAALRRTASALATSNDIKVTKDNLDGIITDTWDEHTGDVDNLLNMDSTAAAESLTSDQNPTPQSIQVLIRSQEIKVPDKDEDETAAAAADKGSFWSRVGQMFKDFWSSITGIFH